MNYPDRYLLFIEYFNQGKYMSAQSTLSEVWLETGGENKNFFGGLTQLAVSLYHLQENNLKGAQSNFEKSLDLLESYGDQHFGIDLKSFMKEAKSLFETMKQNPEGVLPPLPKLSFSS